MKTTVRATYTNGAIVPVEPLDIEEGTKLSVSINAESRASHVASERKRESAETLARQLTAIGRHCASLLKDGPSAAEHGDWLYDENGLPK